MHARRAVAVTLILVSAMALLAGPGFAAEKAFPTKPITLVIPFQPGDTDNNLRPFVEKMAQYLGQPINLVYKSGASGAVGAGYVASAAPDGYTLVGSSQSSLTIVPHTQKGSTYTWQSFSPICGLAEGAMVIAVQAGSRWKTAKDLLAEAKQHPDKISWSSGSGALGATTLLAQVFFKEAGVKLNLVPAQGSGPAVTAILGGHVDAVSTAITPAFSHIKAGTLRPLVVFSDKRIRSLPDVPTAVELGYTVNALFLYGLLAPKGTPKPVVDSLHSAAKKTIEEHGAVIEKQLSNIGVQIGFRGPDEYGQFLKAQDQFWSTVAKSMETR